MTCVIRSTPTPTRCPSIGRRQLVLVDGRTFAISDEAGQMTGADARPGARRSAPPFPVRGHRRRGRAPKCSRRARRPRCRRWSSPGWVQRRRSVVARGADPSAMGGQRAARRRARPQHFAARVSVDLALASGRRLRPRVRRQGRSVAIDRTLVVDDGRDGRSMPTTARRATAIRARAASRRRRPASRRSTWRPRRRRVAASVWSAVTVEPVVDGVPAGLAFPVRERAGRRDPDAPAGVVAGVGAARRVRPIRGCRLVVEQALADIAALRIIDSAHADRPVIAAGAPWFMTLFGRDSLLDVVDDAAVRPRPRASGVLSTLAELQGTVVRPGRRGAARQDPPRVAPPRRRRTVRDPASATTAPSTPRRCSSCSPPRRSRWGALERRRPRAPGARRRRRPRVDARRRRFQRRRLRRLPAQRRVRSVQPGLEGLVGRRHVRRRLAARRARSRSSKCRATSTPRCSARRSSPRSMASAPRPPTSSRARASALQARVQRTVLGRPWLVRHRPRRRRSPDRLADDQPWPRAVDRHRRCRARRSLPRPSDGARDVDRLGPAHAGRDDGRLRPAQLPQRIRVAARHRAVRRRAPRATVAGTSSTASSTARFDAASEFDGRPPELFAGIARRDARCRSYPASCSPQAWSSASILLLMRTMLGLDRRPTGRS